MDPAFQAAFRTATESYRATLEPGNLAMALEIRDDRTARPKERIRAGEFLRGPKAAPGVTVNVSQVNATAPAGYVIDLSGRPRDSEPPPKTIDMSPKEGNAADLAADVVQERAEAKRSRPRRHALFPQTMNHSELASRQSKKQS